MSRDRSRLSVCWTGALLGSALLLCCASGGCRKSDPGEQIRELVRAAARAAGERNVAGVMANVADDFSGHIGLDSGDDVVGAVDARQLRFLLIRYLQRSDGPSVLIRSIDVKLTGTLAEAKVLTMIAQSGGAAGPRGAIEPDRGETMQLDLTLEQRDGRWLVTTAKRTPIAAGDFLLGK
jgi:hypothetical protein